MTSGVKDIKQKINKYPTAKGLMLGVLIGMLSLFAFEKINNVFGGCDIRLVYIREVEDCDRIDEKTESFSDVEKVLLK